jgi:hypothetical protein
MVNPVFEMAKEFMLSPVRDALGNLGVNVEDGMYKIYTLRNLLAKSKRGY